MTRRVKLCGLPAKKSICDTCKLRTLCRGRVGKKAITTVVEECKFSDMLPEEATNEIMTIIKEVVCNKTPWRLPLGERGNER